MTVGESLIEALESVGITPVYTRGGFLPGKTILRRRDACYRGWRDAGGVSVRLAWCIVQIRRNKPLVRFGGTRSAVPYTQETTEEARRAIKILFDCEE